MTFFEYIYQIFNELRRTFDFFCTTKLIFTDKIQMHVDNIYESKIIIIMTTNLTYNQLLEWDKYDLIDQILSLQVELNELTSGEVEC